MLKDSVLTVPQYSLTLIKDRFVVYYPFNNFSTSCSFGKSNFADDVQNSLSAAPKYLHSKYFYDSVGSELFERICVTKEYYLSRTEESILKRFSDEMSILNSDKKLIVELGSGTSLKTRHILASFINSNGKLGYVPIDTSDILIESSEKLIEDFENLYISGILSEYYEGIEIVNELFAYPKLLLFLGSSIGNFEPEESKSFLSFLSSKMYPDDTLLVGFDMKKDRKVLNAAYNDREGITAKFNLNLLTRINDELGGQFNLDKFVYYNYFNEEMSRMEMHLVTAEDQIVYIEKLDDYFYFERGESIHTENSYKFTDEMIEEIADSSGLKISKIWKDENNYFSLVMFKRK